MKLEMRRSLARLPYPEKLLRVAELIEFSRRFKSTPFIPSSSRIGAGDYVKTHNQLVVGASVNSLFEQAKAAE